MAGGRLNDYNHNQAWGMGLFVPLLVEEIRLIS